MIRWTNCVWTGLLLMHSTLYSQPIHFWPFYENADEASTVNAILTSDRFDNPDYAYQFDGITSYIEYVDDPSLDITGEISIETWIYLDSSYANIDRTILVKSEGNSNVDIPSTYYLGTSGDSTYRFCVGGQEMLFGDVIFNAWTHLAVTFSHDLMRARCYVNNELVLDHPALLNDIQTSDSPLLVGSNTEHNENWNGVIDDIRLFDRMITESEVDSLFNLTFGPHIQMLPEYELVFGNLYVGYPDTLYLIISNIGLGLDSLVISEMSYTGTVFQVDQNPLSLQSGNSMVLPVIFNPSMNGYFSDLVQISTNDPLNPNITYTLTGSAVFPPEITVYPESIQDSLYTGGVGEYTISINNSQGLGDLHWSLEILNDLDADTIFFQKPSWTDPFLPESQDSISENVYLTREVDYYGLFNAALETECDQRYSPLGTLWGMGRSVDVPRDDYRYWMYHVYEPPNIVLDTMMSIRIIETNTHYDLEFLIWRYEQGGAGFSYNRIEAPSFISNFEQRSGTVSAGSSVDIDLQLDAYKSQQYSYNSFIRVSSNDIDEPDSYIPIALEVLEAPDIDVALPTIDLSNTYIGHPDTLLLEVFNVGYGSLSIEDIYSTNAAINIYPTSIEIPQNSSEFFTVIYAPQAPEELSDAISIVSDDPDEGTYIIPILGNGLFPPEISISPDNIQEEIIAGDTLTSAVTITNGGVSTLTYEIYPFTSVYDTMVVRSPWNSPYIGDGKYHRQLYSDADEDSVTVDLRSLSYSISSDTITFFISTYHDLEAYWYMMLQIDYDRNTETGISGADWWRDGTDYDLHINHQNVYLFRWAGAYFDMVQRLDPPIFIYGEDHYSVSLPTHLVRASDGWDIAIRSEMDLYQYTDIMPEFDEPPITIPMWMDKINLQTSSGTNEPGGVEDIVFDILPTEEDSSSIEARMIILSNDPEHTEFPVPIHLDIVVSLDGTGQLPQSYQLRQNYPNPFNPNTTIEYDMLETSDVTLVIYDLRGREVRSWDIDGQEPGSYCITWSGLSDQGVLVSSGVYLLRIQADDYSSAIKMVYLK